MKKYWKVTLFSENSKTYTYVTGENIFQAVLFCGAEREQIKSVAYAKGYSEKMAKRSKYKHSV